MTSVDWKVHTYATLPSTQQYVLELAEEGLPEGTVVQSLTQTKGHGRYGRTWESPLGNLYMSFLLRPDCKAGEAVQLSFVTALAVSAAIERYIAKDHKKTLKWPNDILIDGHKCAGILIESVTGAKGQVSGLAVGIGVNILSAPEGAACLKDVCDGQVAIHPFRDQVLAEFSVLYKQWQDEGFKPVRDQWLKQAHGLGQTVRLVSDDREESGKLEGIDETGALLLTQNQESKSFTSGSLLFSEGA